MQPPVLEARGVSKVYGHVRALVDVDLVVRAGEIVGLVGDNGAGKSTLVNCLSGAAQPTAGQILVDGTSVELKSPAVAQELGIQTVYQDLSLAPALTPGENIFLGREATRRGFAGRLGLLDRRAMDLAAAEDLGDLSASAARTSNPVSDLSGGQRQAVAIARGVRWATKLVMLDEPTAALGVPQSRMVLDMISGLPERGLPVILISHNMQDVLAVTTRVVVLRLGRVVLDTPTSDTNQNQLVSAITGGVA